MNKNWDEQRMMEPRIEKLNEAVVAAGSILRHYFGKQIQPVHKSTNADYRTKADVETERAIIAAIEKHFPDYNIFAEEHGEIRKDSAYTFVMDPLDGTNNFVLGIPAFTSSVALMKEEEVRYGIIHHPVTGDTYFAVKGKGAFLNGERISVNTEDREQNITVSYYCDYTAPRHRVVEYKTALLNLRIKRYLDLWSPAFCYCALACGRLEAILNDGIELYDYAAGKLIAVEAGARVTNFLGEDSGGDRNNVFLITNGTRIHDYLVDRVTRPLAGL
ncbi:MAG: inositol monophosphatase family protein [Rhodothermales bacterium]